MAGVDARTPPPPPEEPPMERSKHRVGGDARLLLLSFLPHHPRPRLLLAPVAAAFPRPNWSYCCSLHPVDRRPLHVEGFPRYTVMEEEERKDVGFLDLHAAGEVDLPEARSGEVDGCEPEGRETLAQYGTTRLKVDPVDGSLSYREPVRDHGSTDVKPLSYKEEQLTWVFCEQKIQEVSAAFKSPQNTGCSYNIF